VLGIFKSLDEARAVIARLSNRLSPQLELITVSSIEDLYSLSLLDADLSDVIDSIRRDQERVFLVLAIWR